MSGYGHNWKDLWYSFEDAWHYKEAHLSTSQHYRETRPWYVCPRDPIQDGLVFDTSCFFNPTRRLGDHPGKWIAGAFYYGFFQGAYAASQNQSGVMMGKMPKWKNQYTRLGHLWATKRLAFLFMVRPAVVLGSLMSAYWIPREAFSQNFGRRNKRNHYDFLPNAVGCVTMAAAAHTVMGTLWSRPILFYGLIFNSLSEWIHSTGWSIFQAQRENVYPLIMAAMYGLPDKGEGYDMIADGEHAQNWRMESNIEGGYLQMQKFLVRQSPQYDDHPKLRYDWGHTSYTS
eukprot:TRINITY_DN9738_c0_g1_i2.p1 TRINITY_DN9738_c0_g1~~TRINITY_DN9738_c0_g1_i2.p1  ORF type:complete len:286 (+),score=83.06 TRINITY_DN9738_c0_g1_i2:67-924(+)